MKALTIWQPWASLIAAGVKVNETRSWTPPYALIGETIAIHAAARPVLRPSEYSPVLLTIVLDTFGVGPWLLPRGAVIATARLTLVVRTEEIRNPDALGDYSPGRFAWLLEEIVPIDPVPARGYQRFWEWDGPTLCPTHTDHSAYDWCGALEGTGR